MDAGSGQAGVVRSLLLLLLFLTAVAGTAGELLSSDVERRGDHFILQLDMRLHAPAAKVYAALLDFPHLPKINNSIKSARELSHKGIQHRVKLVIEGCVWIFCRRVHEVDTLIEAGDGYLISVTQPKYSDFRYGHAQWRIIDEGKTTRVTYNADYVPDFWVPPLIGTAIFKHSMLKEGKKTLNGLEKLVQSEATK